MPDVFTGDTEVGGNLGDVYTVREDLFAGTSVDGNGGTDTLDADGAWVIADAVSLLDLEVLALDTDQLTLSTTDFASFEDITGSGAASEGLVALTAGGVTPRPWKSWAWTSWRFRGRALEIGCSSSRHWAARPPRSGSSATRATTSSTPAPAMTVCTAT